MTIENIFCYGITKIIKVKNVTDIVTFCGYPIHVCYFVYTAFILISKLLEIIIKLKENKKKRNILLWYLWKWSGIFTFLIFQQLSEHLLIHNPS